jgi:hypothetical protein
MTGITYLPADRSKRGWTQAEALHHKKPSKSRRDTRRLEAHLERQRLFGYVELRNGESLSLGEAERRLRKHLIGQADIREWHAPEAFRDPIRSLGEIVIAKKDGYYPKLGLSPGVVLSDPKIHHKDPYLFRNRSRSHSG